LGSILELGGSIWEFLKELFLRKKITKTYVEGKEARGMKGGQKKYKEVGA
jgi:hypothetical protein